MLHVIKEASAPFPVGWTPGMPLSKFQLKVIEKTPIYIMTKFGRTLYPKYKSMGMEEK
jgi:hypothetical protein